MRLIEKSWCDVLEFELKKSYFKTLTKFLLEEKINKQTVFPPEDKIFNAFEQTPYSKVRVVIVGQDPYHGNDQAEGLCFSVKKGLSVPPSLKNIYKELFKDVGVNPPSHGCLEKWANQGVFLLNSILTVRKGFPGSHSGVGWEKFTDAVIKVLFERKSPTVFMLWGRLAKEKCNRLFTNCEHPHKVLVSAHPSPFSVKGFFGCRHFSQANKFLKSWEKPQINWSLNA